LAREAAKGAGKIGTTGRGIGPAYEDKVARRAIRLQDLFYRERFAAKLGEVLDYHNFVLKNYFQADTVDFQRTLDDTLALAEQIKPMVADVSNLLYEANRSGERLLFEGAQGSLLDVDHGTYPFVTSSNTVAGGASTGAGVAPQMLNYVLGITKAYTTRVGSGPFPTELEDEVGQHLAKRGHEFGATTGRARRCGWFDAAALKRSIQVNGVSGLCVTKLDVLDGMETLQIGVGYQTSSGDRNIFPNGAEELQGCTPVYEEMPGWKESTEGIKKYEDLPLNAKKYLKRMEEVCGVPVDIISTGPDREETIVLRHPFGAK
jgi:adenylosuccinate synthase